MDVVVGLKTSRRLLALERQPSWPSNISPKDNLTFGPCAIDLRNQCSKLSTVHQCMVRVPCGSQTHRVFHSKASNLRPHSSRWIDKVFVARPARPVGPVHRKLRTCCVQ